MFKLRMTTGMWARVQRAGLLWAIPLLLLIGCQAQRVPDESWNRQIDVFGIAFFSRHDDKSIRGVIPNREPCLKGFDYVYEPLNLTVGYGTDDRVRKIVTRNRDSSLFGIHVGDAFSRGRDSLLQAGFTPGDTPYRVMKSGFLFQLLVDSQERIFGMALEALE